MSLLGSAHETEKSYAKPQRTFVKDGTCPVQPADSATRCNHRSDWCAPSPTAISVVKGFRQYSFQSPASSAQPIFIWIDIKSSVTFWSVIKTSTRL